jgi:arylformamidase
VAQYSADFVEREYNTRAAVPEHPQFFRRWAERGARTREQLARRLDVRYGRAEKETLDFFPASDARSLLVFIHGGYWRALDKSDFSWIADAFVPAGISVALVNYTLCPLANVAQIVRECERALAWLYRHEPKAARHMVVSGHSAGGHLTAMMYLADWQAYGLPADIVKAGVAVSGVFDLEPLKWFSYNSDIRLDDVQVAQLSPLNFKPRRHAPLAIAVGGDESGEFKRQSQQLFEAWPQVCPLGMNRPLLEPGAHHHRVMDRFAEPTSELFRTTLKLCLG